MSMSFPDTRTHFLIRNSLWNIALKSCCQTNGRTNIPFEARVPDSPLVAMIWQGRAETEATPYCPADIMWYMRFLKRDGTLRISLQGPTSKATPVSYIKGDEFLGIRFKPGVFMPHFPLNVVTDGVLGLAQTSCQTFQLDGSAWEVPTYQNADIFVTRLLRTGLLDCDPVVGAVLQGHTNERTLRSVQQHFLRATGLPKKIIEQVERVRYAAVLLEKGLPIADVVNITGYFDQPHLSRSLKRFFSQTPAQIARVSQKLE